MHQNFIASFMAALNASLVRLVTALPPPSVVAQAKVGTGYMRTSDKTWWVKMGPGSTLTQLGGIGGGFNSQRLLWVAWDAPAGGDGTQGMPFNTIQQACDAVALGSQTFIMIAPGAYDEDLAITGTDRDIALCGLGAWTLGYIGGPPRNIVWTVESGATTIIPGLELGSIQNADTGVISAFSGEGSFITGSVTGQTSSTPGTVYFSTSMSTAGGIDFSSFAAASTQVLAQLYRVFTGTINGPSTFLVYAEDCVLGDLNVYSIAQVERSVLLGPVVMATSMPPPGFLTTSGFFCCQFAGNITGPGTGFVYMDGSSFWSFNGGGFSVIGDTLMLMDEIYVASNPASWVGAPPTTTQAAIDRIAAMIGPVP